MEPIRKINDELAISGQITPQQLEEIAQAGYRSVLNLRSPDEAGFLSNEQQQAEALGLDYVNIPVEIEAINNELATLVLQQIDQLAKPTLLHCNSAMRAAALALMHIATRQGITLEQAYAQAKQLGLFSLAT